MGGWREKWRDGGRSGGMEKWRDEKGKRKIREEMNPLTGCMPCCFMVRWMNLGSLEEGEVHIVQYMYYSILTVW